MSRTPQLRLSIEHELIVDQFAGGGGASLGIEMALGRSPDIAINHDPEAVALHQANHPTTEHYCESVWDIDPVAVTHGRPVGLMWLSPDCKHFSKAKGGKPVEKKIRGLAWIAVKWAKLVRPRVIILENVEEFQTWGPLTEDNMPCPIRRGLTFRRWVKQLENCGYAVEWRELRASDYGVPTIRKRLFLVARCDGQPITWPQPTHGKGREPYRTAAECIEWSLPCPSIFERERPLAENTLKRIAAGIKRYVIDSPEPFIVPIAHYNGRDTVQSIREPLRTITANPKGGSHALVTPFVSTYYGPKREAESRGVSMREPLPTQTTENRHSLIAPTLIQTGYGERDGQAPRALDIEKPVGTLVGSQKHALVSAFLAKHYTGVVGATVTDPMPTVTTVDHNSLVMAFLQAYYGTLQDPTLADPLHTITTKDRYGLVTVHGLPYYIADIGMRMLQPRELYRAQGFPEDYRIDITYGGKPLTKTAQVRMCGNSVCPPMAAAIVAANYRAMEMERAA